MPKVTDIKLPSFRDVQTVVIPAAEKALNEVLGKLVGTKVVIKNEKGAQITAPDLHSVRVELNRGIYQLRISNRHPKTKEAVSAGDPINLTGKMTLLHEPIVEKDPESVKATVRLKEGSIIETANGLNIPDASKTNASTLSAALQKFVGQAITITVISPRRTLHGQWFQPEDEEIIIKNLVLPTTIASENNLSVTDKSSGENSLIDLGRVGASITIVKANPTTFDDVNKIARPVSISLPYSDYTAVSNLEEGLKDRRWLGDNKTPVHIQSSIEGIDMVATIASINAHGGILYVNTQEDPVTQARTKLRFYAGEVTFSKPSDA